MHEAETRIPLQLLLDSRVQFSAFRLWCWLDHLCRARRGPVVLNYQEIRRQTGWAPNTVRAAVENLVATDWLRQETADGGPSFPNRGYSFDTTHKL